MLLIKKYWLNFTIVVSTRLVLGRGTDSFSFYKAGFINARRSFLFCVSNSACPRMSRDDGCSEVFFFVGTKGRKLYTLSMYSNRAPNTEQCHSKPFRAPRINSEMPDPLAKLCNQRKEERFLTRWWVACGLPQRETYRSLLTAFKFERFNLTNWGREGLA